MKKFLTILGVIGQVAAVATYAGGAISPKVAVAAGGVATVAAAIGDSVLKYRQASDKSTKW